ncbi:hypothetical protein QAD02_010460 [Eretmocerus hayati]|uniref:Uncharacterized protein n=1 Tax=Eretmocerus hayati TaxID=131215 RepID=A0ACC2NWL2_9HYME|nr:hypothetical protein QAD02_010460 [Eretmocerus hayati]
MDGYRDEIIECPKCQVSFIGVAQLAKHAGDHHSRVEIHWRCIRCHKIFKTKQAWACHQPKCSEVIATNEARVHKCEECGGAFTTQRGLSMHIMHQHPETSNRIRRERAEKSNVKKKRTGKVWTEEELARIKRYEIIYRNEKRMNVSIAQHFPGRTCKQVSNARQRIKEMEERGEALPPIEEGQLRRTEGNRESNEGEESTGSTPTEHEEMTSTNTSDDSEIDNGNNVYSVNSVNSSNSGAQMQRNRDEIEAEEEENGRSPPPPKSLKAPEENQKASSV